MNIGLQNALDFDVLIFTSGSLSSAPAASRMYDPPT